MIDGMYIGMYLSITIYLFLIWQELREIRKKM